MTTLSIADYIALAEQQEEMTRLAQETERQKKNQKLLADYKARRDIFLGNVPRFVELSNVIKPQSSYRETYLERITVCGIECGLQTSFVYGDSMEFIPFINDDGYGGKTIGIKSPLTDAEWGSILKNIIAEKDRLVADQAKKLDEAREYAKTLIAEFKRDGNGYALERAETIAKKYPDLASELAKEIELAKQMREEIDAKNKAERAEEMERKRREEEAVETQRAADVEKHNAETVKRLADAQQERDSVWHPFVIYRVIHSAFKSHACACGDEESEEIDPLLTEHIYTLSPYAAAAEYKQLCGGKVIQTVVPNVLRIETVFIETHDDLTTDILDALKVKTITGETWVHRRGFSYPETVDTKKVRVVYPPDGRLP